MRNWLTSPGILRCHFGTPEIIIAYRSNDWTWICVGASYTKDGRNAALKSLETVLWNEAWMKRKYKGELRT